MHDELVIDAVVRNLPKVMAFIEGYLKQTDCGAKARMQICVAVEEIFVNIATYAYKGRPGSVEMRIEFTQDPAVMITFADYGAPFDPLENKDPDVTLPASERRIGGLGIYMAKKSMDCMEYDYRDGKNILTLKKKL